MTATDDAPSMADGILGAVMAGALDLSELLDRLPTGEVRAYLAQRDGDDPPEVLTADELLAGLPEDLVARFAHAHKIKQPAERIWVEQEVLRLRARRAAQELIDAETRGTGELPRMTSLDAFLAEPDEDVAYRIEGLWPKDGRIVLTAPMKAGKTTMTGNLLRSLVDGTSFLGHFAAHPVERVVLLDDEMSEAQLRRWLRDHGIKAAHSISIVSLRGRLSSFNILDTATRTRWANYLGAADVLIFDCLRPALDALGLNEHTEIGRFLEALDELVAEAGIRELLVVHHMGYGAERGRGDSRIGDWPDATWKIVLSQKPDGSSDEHGARFFSAMGRDVEQHEARLGHDSATRRLTIEGGSRAQAALTKAEQTVLDCLGLADAPPSGSALEAMAAAAGVTQADYRRARAQLVLDGRVLEEARPGRGGGKQYSLAPGEVDEL